MRRGLRAELAPAHLFPGDLAVTLEMRPGAQPVEQRPPDADLPEIPTTGMPLEAMGEKMTRLADRIEAMPLEETVARLNGLIESAKRLVENPALARLLTNLAEGSSSLVPAAKQLDPTLHEVRAMGGRAGELMQETQKLMEDLQPLAADVTRTLDQIDDTARSMRLLADMLERQPQAILRGKGQ